MPLSKQTIKRIKAAANEIDHPLVTRKEKIIDYIEEMKYQFCQWFSDINPLYIFRRMKRFGFLLKNFRISVKTLPASWVDSDQQMLHTNFQILVNFVESECAIMTDNLEIEGHKEAKTKRDKGILYLKSYIDNPDIDDTKTPTWSEACQQILDLYNWWTIKRPARKDPHDLILIHLDHDTLMSYWTSPIDTREQFMIDNPEFAEQYPIWQAECEICRIQEESYEIDDEAKLIQLIKVRKYMWS